jgi:hypothetical protein
LVVFLILKEGEDGRRRSVQVLNFVKSVEKDVAWMAWNEYIAR